MNTITKMSTLPYLPTELWNKIYDYKGAMEARDAHKHGMYETFRFIKGLGYLTTNWQEECTCARCDDRCWEVDKTASFDFNDMVGTSYGNHCPDCIDSIWDDESWWYEATWGCTDGYTRFLDDLESGNKPEELE